MDGIETFLRPGSRYFEQAPFVVDESLRFAFDHSPLPEGWTRSPAGRTPWTSVHAPAPLPEAGWKLHVAARLDDADGTLSLVAEECLDAGVAFKYMPSRNILHMMERKYAPLTSAGKFITVYPAEEAQLERLVARLTSRLAGRPAAVAVTDIPLPGCPIGVRFGAFREEWTALDTGLDALAFRGPDGRLHVDSRRSGRTVPEGVAVPAVVAAALEARAGGGAGATLPYTVTRALHRSNGGGVYDALTPEGERVVLKEGRRHTGLGLDGRDAAASLADEARALRALAGVPGVPRHVAEHEIDGRLFLAMEHMTPSRSTEFLARHHPGMHADPGPEAWASYGRRVERIVGSLRRTVGALHERGWSFGDLHPGNVLIGEDDAVALIDFETASDDPEAAGDRFTVAPGFRLRGISAREADLVRIDLFHLWALSPDNAFWEFSDQVMAARVEQFRPLLPRRTAHALTTAVAGGFAAQRWGMITPLADHEDGPDLRDAARGTLMDAAERWGRAEAGAPAPVDAGATPWSLGGGMAGLLWAVRPWADGRLDDALDRLAAEASASPRMLPGLYTGRAGAAMVLGEYGREAPAAALLDRALEDARHVRAPGLESGLAGIGWAALSAGRFAEARDLAERALDAVEAGGGGRGLMEGPSGPALLALRLARVFAEDAWVERAARALELDRRHLVWRPDGTVLLDRGNLKHQPDLGYGSLGVAFVAHRLGRAAPERALDRLVSAAGATCLDVSWATQGLMRGRTGALAFLAEREGRRTPAEDRLLAGNLRGLRRYLVRAEGRVHLPGHLHLRFSHSLVSGLAGAVRVLDRLDDPDVQLLPGLEPLTTHRRTPAGGVTDHRADRPRVDHEEIAP